MPWYVINGMHVHVKLGGPPAKHPKPCVGRTRPENPIVPSRRCCAPSNFLCDWLTDSGKGTCDAPLCPEHAIEVGRNRHYCPTHAALDRAREPELFP